MKARCLGRKLLCCQDCVWSTVWPKQCSQEYLFTRINTNTLFLPWRLSTGASRLWVFQVGSAQYCMSWGTFSALLFHSEDSGKLRDSTKLHLRNLLGHCLVILLREKCTQLAPQNMCRLKMRSRLQYHFPGLHWYDLFPYKILFSLLYLVIKETNVCFDLVFKIIFWTNYWRVVFSSSRELTRNHRHSSSSLLSYWSRFHHSKVHSRWINVFFRHVLHGFISSCFCHRDHRQAQSATVMTRVGNSDTLTFDPHSAKNGNAAVLGETKKKWMFLFPATGPCAYTPIFLVLLASKCMDQFLPFQVVVG